MYKFTDDGYLAKEHEGYTEYLGLADILRQLGIDDLIKAYNPTGNIKIEVLKFLKEILENPINLADSKNNYLKGAKTRTKNELDNWKALKDKVKLLKVHESLKVLLFVWLAKIHFYASIIPKFPLSLKERALYVNKANTLYFSAIEAFIMENEKTIRKLSLYNFFPPFEKEYMRILVTVKDYKSLQVAFKPINIVDLVEEFINNESNAKTRKQFFSSIQVNLAHCRCFKHKNKNIKAQDALKLWNSLHGNGNVFKRVMGRDLLPALEVVCFIWSAKIHFYILISNKKEANTAYFIAIKNFVKNYRGINGARSKVYSLLPTDDAVIFAVLTKNFNDGSKIAKNGKFTNGNGNYVIGYIPEESKSRLSDETKNTIRNHFTDIKNSLNFLYRGRFKALVENYCK